MIELPEAMSLAAQMRGELVGRVIEHADCGNSPHKWAFYSRPQEDYAMILPGKEVVGAMVLGNLVAVSLAPGFALVLGDGGVRVLLHESQEGLPDKYQLLLRFTDRTCLTASVQGWGFLGLLDEQQLADRAARQGISPLSDAFTYARFKGLVQGYQRREQGSVKEFLISGGGIAGIGNGYLQGILFRAGIHPRRKVAEITGRERQRLYHAMRGILRDAAEARGRDTERDLHNRPGGYRVAMDTRAKGQPCPECGTIIERIRYLGGSCYLCPRCQT